MAEHQTELRILLVDQYSPYSPTTGPSAVTQQVVRALAHEGRRRRTNRRRHRLVEDVIDDDGRTS